MWRGRSRSHSTRPQSGRHPASTSCRMCRAPSRRSCLDSQVSDAMRILILSIYHDPEPIPKTGELARELQRRGHTVTVVTAFPHYPSGALYPGYALRPWRWEVRQGVRVLRTFIYPYHGTSSALRMANYLSWMVSSIQAAWLTPACDVMYVWHPPLTVGVSAWVL